MANSDAKLKVAELDFDKIRDNLKQYLKSQSEFSDYNFEGSGMSVLLDLLSYNTHYMGYYLNMVANEMFIDTALTRQSVVSHAKLLGYTPRSRVAARAAVDLLITPVPNDSNSRVLIPRFTRFVSETKDGANYIFVTPSSRVATKNSSTGLFELENLELKEGQPTGFTFTYDAQTNPKQYFEIPDSNIDTSTLQVSVQVSAENANQETYILSEDATNVDSDARVFYLEENKNGKYQIYFGDGVIGKQLTDGNIVVLSYIVTSCVNANGLRTFKLLDTLLAGNTSTAITLVNESSSGAAAETIDKIRFTAPKAYISQNRAVTKNDYIALINRDYPYFDAVNVWGGEEVNPPVYGKVFFSAKPLGGYEITATEIEHVKTNILKPFSVLTVTPEYVPADYNYVNVRAEVWYDPTKTNKTSSEVNAAVIAAIRGFASTNLNSFNSIFRVSQISRAVDDCDNSIVSNDIFISLEKRFFADSTKRLSYTLDFNTELIQGTASDHIQIAPSFKYYDDTGVLRDCYIEEVIQSYTGVDDISVLAPGSGYTTTPEVIIEGDGQGATAEALIVNGQIKKIVVTNTGSDYTSASARVVGGGGIGALLDVNLQGRTGRLKSYYFDEVSPVKKTIDANIGVIDYKTGIVKINNFQPVSVSDPFGTLVVHAIPARKVFSSSQNKIVTMDLSDPGSVTTVITPVVG
jgi:hypothetical protein